MQPSEKAVKQISAYLMFDTVLDQNPSGTIYKARHKDTNEACLIKVITKERSKQDPAFHERIRQEEKQLQDLINPRILRFLTFIETGNYYYFISEGSEEGTLENYLNKTNQGMTEEETIGILIMILQGYYDFFRRNIPYNNMGSKILYKFGSEYKLSLFFVSEYYEKMETSFKNSKAPSPYTSPESLEGNEHTSKSDIWSLGVLLYEMIFARIPFNGDNILQLSKNIDKNCSEVYKNIERSNKISSDFKGLLKKMLDVESKRISWGELIDLPILKNYKIMLQNALIQDYDSVSDEFNKGKIKLKAGKSIESVKNLPVIPKTNNSSESPILKKDIRDLLQCLDNNYGFKARLLQTLEVTIRNWNLLLYPTSPKKPLSSPKKKSTNTHSPNKNKASIEKWIDEPDPLDEGINVNLPQSSGFMLKNSMKSEIGISNNQKEPSKSKNIDKNSKSTTLLNMHKIPSKVTSKDENFNETHNLKQNKETLKEIHKKKHKSISNDTSSDDDNAKKSETLKIMKPGVYPQITPHDRNTEKARMSYLKSLRLKKETLKPILEMSIEESSTFDTLTISVVKRNFQDIVREFFYRYLHENDILDFLYNVNDEMIKLKTDIEHEFQSYCIMKLIMMRFAQLKGSIDNKSNVFNLDFWKEIVNLDMYKEVKTCIMENEKKYKDAYDKSYLKAKNSNKNLTIEQNKFLQSDFNVPHSEFNKNFNEAIISLIWNLYDEGKNIEKKDQKSSLEVYSLTYRLMFCLEISKILSFIKLDLDLEFDMVEFQEKLIGYKPETLIEEVESHKNKLNEIKK